MLSEICLTMGPFLLPQLPQLVTGMSVNDPKFLADAEEFLQYVGKRLDEHDYASAASAPPSSSDPGVVPPTWVRNERSV